jgi:hypothetical protein
VTVESALHSERLPTCRLRLSVPFSVVCFHYTGRSYARYAKPARYYRLRRRWLDEAQVRFVAEEQPGSGCAATTVHCCASLGLCSGGVIYAGGGTSQQLELRVHDDVESMTRYISRECNGAVDESTVRTFCAQSAANLRWLQTRGGVSFQSNEDGSSVVFLRKTSYPPSNVTLYNSGNESSLPWCGEAKPAPRGHRVAGEHLTGHALFDSLHRAVSADPRITVRTHVVARALHVEAAGAATAVVGLRVSALRMHDELAALHDMLSQIGSGAPYIDPSGNLDEVRCPRGHRQQAQRATWRRIITRCGAALQHAAQVQRLGACVCCTCMLHVERCGCSCCMLHVVPCCTLHGVHCMPLDVRCCIVVCYAGRGFALPRVAYCAALRGGRG